MIIPRNLKVGDRVYRDKARMWTLLKIEGTQFTWLNPDGGFYTSKYDLDDPWENEWILEPREAERVQKTLDKYETS